MNESTRDWSPNKDRGRRRGGSEDDEDEDFMPALTHSPSQQEHAHTQHTPQASPKKRSTQSIQPQLGKRKRGKPPMLKEFAQPEQQLQQHQQHQQQQRHLSHRLRYIVVPFEQRQSSLILQPEPLSRNVILVASAIDRMPETQQPDLQGKRAELLEKIQKLAL